jgi:hypothetical protein
MGSRFGGIAVAKTKKSVVTLDRREESDRRAAEDRRKKSVVVQEDRRGGERREKVQRRRQIDPTTCERDYTDEEIEFMQAMDAYKRANGRMFPTCSEILEVLRGMGYERVSASAATEASDALEVPAAEEADAEAVTASASDGQEV